MPYVGQKPSNGRFIELDALTASATATYTLQYNSVNYAPESVHNLIVSINGVVQKPSSMSLSGSSLTVGATLSSSDTIDYVRVLGDVGSVVTPTDGSVTAAKIGTGAVTDAKLATSLDFQNITIKGGSTNAMTVSSTGVISEPNRPCFHVTKSADQTVSDNTATLVTFDEITDGGNSKRQINVGGGYASNKFTVTAQTKGIYFFYLNLFFGCSDVYYDAYCYWRKNGSDIIQLVQATGPSASGVKSGSFHNNCLINLDTSGDYVELFAYADVASGGTMNLNQNSLTVPRTEMGGFKIA